MRILCLHGTSQYRLMNAFLDAVADGFAACGHDVVRAHVRDAATNGVPAGVDLVFTLGGIGAGVQGSTPMLTWLVDNPVWTRGFAQLDAERDGVLVVAQEHVGVLDAFLGFGLQTGFVPHGIACDPAAPPPRFDDDVRDIDVLLAGSYQPAPRPQPNTTHPAVVAVLETTMQLGADRWDRHMRELEVSALFAEAEAQHLLAPMIEVHRLVVPTLAWLDGDLRERRRLACVRALDRAGVRVHLVGAGWDAAGGLEHAVRTGPVDHEEVLALARRAKVVLNAGPPLFNGGWHERIPMAMAAGALCVTEVNDYVAADPFVAPLVATFEMPAHDALADVVRAALRDPDRHDRARRGYDLVRAHHTWAHRAQAIAEMVDV